jgi:anti-sigma B factor antagonist
LTDSVAEEQPRCARDNLPLLTKQELQSAKLGKRASREIEVQSMTTTANPAQPGIVSFQLPAEIDLTNAEQLCAALCAHAAAGGGIVIADMTATRFCDSAGFRMLLVANDHLAASAVQLKVVIPDTSPVMRALKLIGFDQVLEISPAPPDAVSA